LVPPSSSGADPRGPTCCCVVTPATLRLQPSRLGGARIGHGRRGLPTWCFSLQSPHGLWQRSFPVWCSSPLSRHRLMAVQPLQERCCSSAAPAPDDSRLDFDGNPNFVASFLPFLLYYLSLAQFLVAVGQHD
jgi:hypothetical protein